MNYRSTKNNLTNQILPHDVQHPYLVGLYLFTLVWHDSITMSERPVRLTELATCAG
jgi:hypothetical protein